MIKYLRHRNSNVIQQTTTDASEDSQLFQHLVHKPLRTPSPFFWQNLTIASFEINKIVVYELYASLMPKSSIFCDIETKNSVPFSETQHPGCPQVNRKKIIMPTGDPQKKFWCPRALTKCPPWCRYNVVRQPCRGWPLVEGDHRRETGADTMGPEPRPRIGRPPGGSPSASRWQTSRPG